MKHVAKAYGPTRVFGDVNLHIERGDRIALIGPNGVGKSTMMRMLSGTEEPDSGMRSEGHQASIPPLYGALLKNEQDVHLFEQLLFLQKRGR